MKTSSLCLSLCLSVALVASCSSEDDNSPKGTGGASGKGGSGGSGMGGSSGSGGSPGGTGGSGSGGSTTGTGGSTPGSGGSGSGGAPAGSGGSSGDAGGGSETGGSDMAPSAGGPAGALNFVFDVPCPAGTDRPAGNCLINDAAARQKNVVKMMGGDPATTYMVKLKFCGAVEARSYTGCKTSTENALVCVDGMPNGATATYPTYSMAVSDPMATYFLNSRNLRDDLFKLEYSATFAMKGGSTVTFNTNGGSNADVYTAKFMGHNFTCPGAPMITQPFVGQFIWVSVESVTPM
jgi:hypothetical protein